MFECPHQVKHLLLFLKKQATTPITITINPEYLVRCSVPL
jgi:hypothetical protein